MGNRRLRMNPEGGFLPSRLVSRITRAREGGQALEPQFCRALSTMLGWDLRAVRVHADGKAAELADCLSAAAFTVGTHIFFARSAYDPDSIAGRWLICHEIAHVLQQSAGLIRARNGHLTMLPLCHPGERPADMLAEAAAGASDGIGARTRSGNLASLEDNGCATVLQRKPNRFVSAALNRYDPIPVDPKLKPRSNQEAVLGWLLASLGYPRNWKLLRKFCELMAMEEWRTSFWMPLHEGWMMRRIYAPPFPVTRSSVKGLAQKGDILLVNAVHLHSMVVVDTSGADKLLIRGFNDRFLWSDAPQFYDPIDRDVLDPDMWDNDGTAFGYRMGTRYQLLLVKYHLAAINTAKQVPWEGSEYYYPPKDRYEKDFFHRWHYNLIQGWRYKSDKNPA